MATTPDHLIVWTDSEIAGLPDIEFRPKLQTNVLANCAMVITGSLDLLCCVNDPFRTGGSFDEIVGSLPFALRRRSGAVAARLARWSCGWMMEQRVVVAGFSVDHGRALVAILDGASYFEPRLGLSAFSPAAGEDERGPRDLQELLAFAGRQMTALREGGHPSSTGGALQVASIEPGRMTTWLIPDFYVSAQTHDDAERSNPANITS